MIVTSPAKMNETNFDEAGHSPQSSPVRFKWGFKPNKILVLNDYDDVGEYRQSRDALMWKLA
jgi:hypothetical protein